MKTITLTSALVALSLSVSFAGNHDHDDDHDDDHGSHRSLAHDSGTKSSFLKRLAIAPTHYGCGANVHAVENAALSAPTVRMLCKVEYDYGKSWLGHHSEEEIEEMILNCRMPLGSDTLIVILGYADRTGCADKNYRLSETRANYVRKHIEHVNWEHHLNFRTTSIAMGEEVELCTHDLGHNRVAEIWLLNFAQPLGQVIGMVAPVVQHQALENHFAPAPVPHVMMPSQPAPQIVTENRLFPTPVQHVMTPTQPAPQIVTENHFVPAPAQHVVVPAQPAPQIVTENHLVPAPAQHIVVPTQPTPQIVTENRLVPAPVQAAPQVMMSAQPLMNPLLQLAEFLEHNVMLSPNADPNEFARQLNLLKSFTPVQP